MDCLFCKIVNKEIPAKIIYEDDNVLAFDDISPQAPIHKIIIPKAHIATLNDMNEDNAHAISLMVQCAAKLAKDLKIDQNGYRIVMNCNKGGGQTVYHIHMHLLGGRSMTWPPG